MKHRYAAVVLCLLVFVTLSGCGSNRPQTVRVAGRITFAGGPPPAAGSLAFAPLEPAAGFPRRAAMGSFDASGNIRVTSFQEGDGLVPGRYEVKVECWRKPPTETSAGESLVPTGFKAPDFEVPAGASGPLNITLDVPAAAK